MIKNLIKRHFFCCPYWGFSTYIQSQRHKYMQFFYFLPYHLKLKIISVKTNRNSVFNKVELRFHPNMTKILLKRWVFFNEHSQITWDFTGFLWFFFYDSTLFFKDIDFFLTLLIIFFCVRQTVILKPSSQISQSRIIYGSQKKTAENTKARWTDTLILH